MGTSTQETLEPLTAYLCGPGGEEAAGRRPPGMLASASDDEIAELRRAFGACSGNAAAVAQAALDAERARRAPSDQDVVEPGDEAFGSGGTEAFGSGVTEAFGQPS